MYKNSMIDAAHALAASRRHACGGDLDLLSMMINQLQIDRTRAVRVVQLGAGSGTMALVVIGMGCDLVTIDHDQHSLWWEQKALENMGWPPTAPAGLARQTLLGDSAEMGIMWDIHINGTWDLLIVDADHSYDTVRADLEAWLPWGRGQISEDFDSRIFMHDYDGHTATPPAPEHYPGVRQACDEIFDDVPMWREGWSAVFESDQWTGLRSTL